MSSSSSSGLPSHSMEYSVVASAFNASMFSIMLFGMYSMIYLYTMYTYLSRKGISQGNVAVLATITALFLIDIALTAAEWITARAAFLDTIGLPIDGVYITFYRDLSLSWDVLLTECGSLMQICLADGLLAWRCYHVWGESIWSIALPATFILAETALNLSVIIIACIQNLRPTPDIAVHLDHLSSAALFMTLGSTLITTSLIAYRIYSVSQGSKANCHKRRFVAILDAIVQSAATYTVISLLYAIEGVVPITLSTETTLSDLQGYTSSLFAATAGAAPTIMVARVALATRHPDVSNSGHHISDLEFMAEHTSGTLENQSGAQAGIENIGKGSQ